MELFKRYVDMIVYVSTEGEIKPLAVLWMENGVRRRYDIDKIVSGPVPRASVVGGCGMRYEVMICGQKRVLFQEREDELALGKSRWFLESWKP